MLYLYIRLNTRNITRLVYPTDRRSAKRCCRIDKIYAIITRPAVCMATANFFNKNSL